MEKIQNFNIGDRVRFVETGTIARHSELIMGKSIFKKVYTIVRSNNGNTFTLDFNGEKCYLISAVQIEHANEQFKHLEIGRYVLVEMNESNNTICYVVDIYNDSFMLNNGIIYDFYGLSRDKNSRVIKQVDAKDVQIEVTLNKLTLIYVSDTEIEFDGGICLLKSDLTEESLDEVERLFRRIEIEE